MALSKGQVEIPYGHPSLTLRAEQIAKRHIVADISAMVLNLIAGRVPELAMLHSHQGLVNPGQKVGVLDWQVSSVEQLEKFSLDFIIWGIAGGNGRPLEVDFGSPRMELTFGLTEQGELKLLSNMAVDDEWSKLAQTLKPSIERGWLGAVGDGLLTTLTSQDATIRRRAVDKWMRGWWEAARLQPAAARHGLRLIEEDDLGAESKTLEYSAQSVYVVTAELAEKLAEVGENAGVLHGLPYWSSPLLDSPAASNALQHLAFLEMGQENTTELTKE